MKLPTNFPKEYSFFDLADWFKENKPSTIEMTLDQEMWYRMILPPQFHVPESVTYRGIQITIYD